MGKDELFSFNIPPGSKVDFYIIDCFGLSVILDYKAADGPSSGYWGCRHFLLDADHQHVVRVNQGVTHIIAGLLIVAANDDPYRVGKLWDHTAVVIPPRFIKYPKVLPSNITFKQMISELGKTFMEELRADLNKVKNCPDLILPSAQQVEAELKADWKALPADLFRYKSNNVFEEVRRWKRKMNKKKKEKEKREKKMKREMPGDGEPGQDQDLHPLIAN